ALRNHVDCHPHAFVRNPWWKRKKWSEILIGFLYNGRVFLFHPLVINRQGLFFVGDELVGGLAIGLQKAFDDVTVLVEKGAACSDDVHGEGGGLKIGHVSNGGQPHARCLSRFRWRE